MNQVGKTFAGSVLPPMKLNTDVAAGCDGAALGLTNTILSICNDPSVGLVRVADNVDRVVPQLVSQRKAYAAGERDRQGALDDASYCLLEVESLSSLPSVSNIARGIARATRAAEALLARARTLEEIRSIAQAEEWPGEISVTTAPPPPPPQKEPLQQEHRKPEEDEDFGLQLKSF
jgi:hypothetical protein